jgi:hypothetical protein
MPGTKHRIDVGYGSDESNEDDRVVSKRIRGRDESKEDEMDVVDTPQAIEEPRITMQYNIIQGMEINITEIYNCNQSTNQFIVGNSEGRILMAVVIEIDTTSHEWRNHDKISVILDAITTDGKLVVHKTPVVIHGCLVHVTPVPVVRRRGGKINMISRKNKNRHSIKKIKS